MATRKPLVLVSGLFEELSTPTDKLDFAGNTTTDLTEGTNLYYTDTRARQSISVTDSGGDGSLSYDNSTGVITYTGPSASEVRAHFSAANSGSGFGSLAYDNSTGAFTYTVVTAANIRQQISVTDAGGDGSLSYDNSTGIITYNGPTASDARAYFSVAVGSGLTYNSTTGEFGTSSIPNSQLANSSVTIGSTSISLGLSSSTLSGLTSITTSELNINVGGTANSILLDAGGITFEGGTQDIYETNISVIDPTADRSIVFPDASGTVALLNSISVAAGSGLTYNSTTGEIGTSNIPNSQLQNSSVTIGSSSVALGGTITTIAGLLSITSSTVLTNDGGFKIRNTADNTKQIAFDASSITTSTIRTLTVQDVNGTIALLEASNSFTGANSFTNVTGQTFRQASTQDGVVIQGRAGGTSSFSTTITPATLSANQTITLPNVTGTVALLEASNAFTGANTFTNTTGQTFRRAATQDGILVTGRSGGTGSFSVTVTPTTLTANRTATFPNLTGTVLLDTSTIPGGTFLDNTFRVSDNTDSTKKLAFECSGITTATTRTMTVPDENGTIATQDFATAIAIALG